jgi:hypothetical protein
MQLFCKIVLLAIGAGIVSILLTIAIDLALYYALADHLSGRSMRIAIDCIDKTEMSRTIGFFVLLLLWTVVLLGIDKGVGRLFGLKRRSRGATHNTSPSGTTVHQPTSP